jgi:hypothetical protein
MLRPLSQSGYSSPKTPLLPGPAPFLDWIEVKRLVVDTAYQRDISKRGQLNVRYIAEHFDWSKFAPVIVAPVEGGVFAIVDGQHRTTAAMIRGIEKVPCQVIQVDQPKQAAAYAAVNGNVTQTTPQQLFHAKLAANDLAAEELSQVCAAAGVEIVRGNLAKQTTRQGQTQAVGALTRCLRDYGRDTLITALQCITQTSDGNPGWIKATIVEALCKVLAGRIEWRDAGESLLRVMDDFDFSDTWEETMASRNHVLSANVLSLIQDRIYNYLSTRLNYDKNQE